MTATATRTIHYAPSATDFDAGAALYKTGKPLASCANDEQRRGWLKAEWVREDAYWQCMMAQASDDIYYEPAIEMDYEDIRRGN